jgi:hypothetical protein
LNCWILPDSGRRRESRGPQTIHKVPCFEQASLTASPGAARYRNIQGQSWDGISKMPDWLQRGGQCGADDGTFLGGLGATRPFNREPV